MRGDEGEGEGQREREEEAGESHVRHGDPQ
jgi:hypothetical protein